MVAMNAHAHTAGAAHNELEANQIPKLTGKNVIVSIIW